MPLGGRVAGSMATIATESKAIWEYYVAHLPADPKSIQNILNIHGRAGWELVAIDVQPSFGMAYFKRLASAIHG